MQYRAGTETDQYNRIPLGKHVSEGQEHHIYVIAGTILTSSKSGEDRRTVHYDAFGQVMTRRVPTPSHTYNGKPRDSMTGLVNYGFRDYHPRQGRFTTVDPIRDGTNWYGYVTNDPLNLIDRYGSETEDRYHTFNPNDPMYSGGLTPTNDLFHLFAGGGLLRSVVSFFATEILFFQKKFLRILPYLKTKCQTIFGHVLRTILIGGKNALEKDDTVAMAGYIENTHRTDILPDARYDIIQVAAIMVRNHTGGSTTVTDRARSFLEDNKCRINSKKISELNY